MWPVDRSHRLNNLLLAIHPLAQFLNSVLVNNFDLITFRYMYSGFVVNTVFEGYDSGAESLEGP